MIKMVSKAGLRMLLLLSILEGVVTSHSQDETSQFDSLQAIIRNEIGEGTYQFIDAASTYDSLAILSKDTLRMGRGKNFMGMHAYFTGSHYRAIQYYLLALPYFEAVRDTFFIALVNNNIGAAYEYRHDPKNSIAYYQKALASFQLMADTLWMANVYNNIAIQYNAAESHDKARVYFDTAWTFYQALGDSAMLATSTANIAECYRFLGELDKAIEMGHQYLNDFEKFHSTDVLSNVYAMLAKAYLEQDQLDQASLYNQRSLAIRDEYDFNFQKANNFETQSIIFERNKDYRNALAFYKLFKTQQDSMLNKEKDDRITELLTEYEVEKKDQEISLLATQNEVNALKIERSNRQRLLYGLGALTLLISALALIYLLRLKSHTNRKLSEKNTVISNALREKDILLREIHHRVKNNLQMISALLYLHGKSVDDASAQEALLESQNRVQSMAMIHQNLYQDENLLGVGVKAYLDKLLEHLISSYNIEKDRITIHKEIEIDHLDVDTIVPMALIINELISNALKYAFRDGRKGEISIYLGQNDAGILMEVKDNGPGFPQGFDPNNSPSFGYKLIHILRERLGASLQITHHNGLNVGMIIPAKLAA
jgi:two-component sensor histidine kinase